VQDRAKRGSARGGDVAIKLSPSDWSANQPRWRRGAGSVQLSSVIVLQIQDRGAQASFIRHSSNAFPRVEIDGETKMSAMVIPCSRAYAAANRSLVEELFNVRHRERLLTQNRLRMAASETPEDNSGFWEDCPEQPRSRLDILFGSSSQPARAQVFECAILPHLDAAYNLARWLTHDPIVAEDIVKDACLRALLYFGSCGIESEPAWLLRIVRNTAYTKLLTLGAHMEVTDVADPDPGPEAAPATIQDLGRAKVAADGGASDRCPRMSSAALHRESFV
jgi:hypothetical protein